MTFRMVNTFTQKIASVFTQFHETPLGETECFEVDSIDHEQYFEYTAYCMKNVPISIVDIWMTDGSFSAGEDDAAIPECCHATNDLPSVQWTFKLYCINEDCPTDRRLEEDEPVAPAYGSLPKAEFGQPKKTGEAKEGHFCSSVDYPCGEEPGHVNVCHYSAKHGYQTFCVPEADSDVLGWYPKDYCGSCVGGYVKE